MSSPRSTVAAKPVRKNHSGVTIQIQEETTATSTPKAMTQGPESTMSRDTVALLTRLALDDSLDPETVFQQAMAMDVLDDEAITKERPVLLMLHRRMFLQVRPV